MLETQGYIASEDQSPFYSSFDQEDISIVSLGGEWRAEIFHSWNLKPEVREEWTQFANDYGDRGLFLLPGWLETWWSVFGKAGRLFIVTLYAGDLLKGIFPCWIDDKGILRGLSSEVYFDFLLDVRNRTAILSKFLDLLKKAGHAHAVFPALSRLEENCAALQKSLRCAHFPFWTWTIGFAPKVDLSLSTWEELEATFQSKLRNNLKKGRRRAEQQGELLFEEVRDPDSLESILEEAFAVEGSGWKAAKGTSILQSPVKVEWYRSISLWAARQGVLRMYLLRLNGRLIAFDLALESGRTVFALKTGYDENIATRFSAGNIMRYEVLKLLWARPEIDQYDFLGEVYPWKLEWTSLTDEIVKFFIYPKTLRGWVKYTLTYGWKQPLKKVRRMIMLSAVKPGSGYSS